MIEDDRETDADRWNTFALSIYIANSTNVRTVEDICGRRRRYTSNSLPIEYTNNNKCDMYIIFVPIVYQLSILIKINVTSIFIIFVVVDV